MPPVDLKKNKCVCAANQPVADYLLTVEESNHWRSNQNRTYIIQKARRSVLAHTAVINTEADCKKLNGIGETIARKIAAAVLNKSDESTSRSKFHYTEGGASQQAPAANTTFNSEQPISQAAGTRSKLYNPARGKIRWQILVVLNFHHRVVLSSRGDLSDAFISINDILIRTEHLASHHAIRSTFTHLQLMKAAAELVGRGLLCCNSDDSGVHYSLTALGHETADALADKDVSELYQLYVQNFGSFSKNTSNPMGASSRTTQQINAKRIVSSHPLHRPHPTTHKASSASTLSPALHRSATLPLRSSTSPALHRSATLPLRSSTSPALHRSATLPLSSSSSPALRRSTTLPRTSSPSLAFHRSATLPSRSPRPAGSNVPKHRGILTAQPASTIRGPQTTRTTFQSPPSNATSASFINLLTPTPVQTASSSSTSPLTRTNSAPRERSNRQSLSIHESIPMAPLLSPRNQNSRSTRHEQHDTTAATSSCSNNSTKRPYNSMLQTTNTRSDDAQEPPGKRLNRSWEDVQLAMEVYGTSPFQSDPSNRNNHPVISPVQTGQWELVLLLDNREVISREKSLVLQNKLLERGILVEVRALTLGDCMWVVRRVQNGRTVEYVQDVVVERKTAEDLNISVMDGRYFEQKTRLKHCGIPMIVYLVEGLLHNARTVVPQRLTTAVTNCRVRDNFMVQQTINIDDTVNFYVEIHNMLKRATTHSSNWQGPVRQPTLQAFNAKNSKNCCETVRDVFGAQLKQFRGCSAAKALELTKLYSTPTALVNALDQAMQASLSKTPKDAAMMLVKTTATNDGIKALSIGRKLAEQIARFYRGEY